MDLKSQNRHLMMKRVMGVLDKYEEVWNANTSIVEVVENIRQALNAVEGIDLQRTALNVPWTEVREEQKKAVVALVFKLESLLVAVAAGANRKDLLANLIYSESDLLYASGHEGVNRMRLILAKAAEMESLLVNFPEHTALMTECQELINNYEVGSYEPSQRRRLSRKLTADMKEYQNRLKEWFSLSLDKFVNYVADEHPDFSAEYRLNRKVPNYGRSRLETVTADPLVPGESADEGDVASSNEGSDDNSDQA